MQRKLLFNLTKVILLVALLTGVNMWGQATLPVSRTAWNTTPTGWTDNAGTPYLTSFACSGNNGAKFETTGNSFTVNFTGTPDKLSFTFKSNTTTSTSSLLVQESSNGTDFTTVVSLSGSSQLSGTCTTKGPYQLNSGTRYVKWTFTKGTSNGTMDDVSITAVTAPSVTTNAASSITSTGAVFNGSVTAANTTVTTSFEYGTTVSYGTTVTPTEPSSASGNSATPFTATVTGLAVNTQYHYRAVGNNGTVYNGSNQSFYTLANVPGTVAIDGATSVSLNVTLDAVSTNSNPATTEFAIQETGGQYVQANGSLGATAYWATAANWQNKTVTGLSFSTDYNFRAKARNGANVETAFGDSALGQTLANTSPLLSTGTLTAFGSVPVGSVAGPTMVEVFGDNLTTADVTVGPLAGYTFSTTSNGTYTSSLTFTQPGGSFAQDVFVIFTPVAAQSYSGNIPVSGGGATTVNIAASGTGVAPTAALSGTLGEATLNGASFTVTLTNGTFNNPLSAAGFTLNNAPSGVTIAGVTYITATTATVVLAYNDADFDTNTNISVTIAGSQTTSNLQVTSGTMTITAVNENLISAGTLPFGNVCINTTSDSSFSLTGTVKAGTINLTAASGYTFSLTNGSNYTSTLSFAVSAGSLSQTIYVRFSPIAVQAYSSSTTISGGGAASSLVKNITGSGINTQATLAVNSPTSVTMTEATLSGRIIALAQCPVSIERGFVYSATSVNATPTVGGTGVTAQSVAGINTTTYTLGVTGLTAATSYTVRTYVYNGSTYTYSSTLVFSTVAPPPANDLCTNPAVLVVDAAAASGTLESATLTPITNADADDYSDVWYTFTPACSGTHTITLSNFTGDMDIYVFGQSCPTDMFTYLDYSASSANTEIAEITALQGTTYTVRVSAYGGSLTTFNIQVTSAASSPIVTTGGATAITSSSANVDVTVSAACGSATGARGVVYATTQNPVIGAASTALGTGDGTFTAQLTGLTNSTTYYVRAYATNDTGTTYSNQVTFTTNNIDAPVADEDTTLNTGGVGFTANWQEVAGATGYRLDVSTVPTFNTPANATDLFFSEYVEGSFTNRYIEIYNGTGASVNLGTYSVAIYNNGANTANTILTLSGTLAAGQTYVIQNNGATAWGGNANLSTGSAVTQFTGNDALELRKNGTAIDRIGTIASNSNFALDVTLRRKSSVLSPTTTYSAGDWDSYETDNVSGLGAHTFDGVTGFFVSGYENKTVSGTSSAVTGLVDGTTYYYRVRAMSANGPSPNSNVITAIADTVYEWNGTAWNPTGTPTAADPVIISGDYNTATDGDFGADNLTINSGVFTVATGTAFTVQNQIINNASAANFVVENDATLLQVNDVNNTGNATVYRYTNELFRLDYTIWSAPVTGQNLFSFSPGTQITRFYVYGNNADNTGTEFLSVSADDSYADNGGTPNFVPGRGYLIRMPNTLNDQMSGYPDSTADYNAGTFSSIFEGQFAGVPNNGDITLPYMAEGKFNIVGNPYPSPINVQDFFADNAANLDPGYGLYFWRKKNNADATSYAVLTADSYIANDGGVESPDGDYTYGGQQWESYYDGTLDENWTIAPGQGFFVRAAAGAPGISFNNQMRQAPQPGQPFYRNGNDVPAQKSKLWFNLTAPGMGFSQASVVYNPSSTLGIDAGKDARHFGTSGLTALFTFAADETLAIQSRPEFTNSDVVPLGYRVNTAGTYTIKLHRMEGVFEGEQEVYLRDNVLNVIHNIKEGDYTFTTEQGTFNSRFDILYTTESLGTGDNVMNADAVVVYRQDNSLTVTTGNEVMQNVTVYDLRGRELYKAQAINSPEHIINGLYIQQQVLLVQVTTAKGTVTKKVIY